MSVLLLESGIVLNRRRSRPMDCELAQAIARFGSRTLICLSEPLFLEKIGVACDVETGIEVADFLRTPPEIICTTAHSEAGVNRDN